MSQNKIMLDRQTTQLDSQITKFQGLLEKEKIAVKQHPVPTNSSEGVFWVCCVIIESFASFIGRSWRSFIFLAFIQRGAPCFHTEGGKGAPCFHTEGGKGAKSPISGIVKTTSSTIILCDCSSCTAIFHDVHQLPHH